MYVIRNNGYVYSPSDNSKNEFSTDFRMATNDFIDIELFGERKVIKWTNKTRNLSYTLNIPDY